LSRRGSLSPARRCGAILSHPAHCRHLVHRDAARPSSGDVVNFLVVNYLVKVLVKEGDPTTPHCG
jgi:hypothetical protein